MPDDEPADDSSVWNLADNLQAWMYEPVPGEFFDPLCGELGGTPSIASPLDVLRLAVFWRSLPWRWHEIAEKEKGAQGEQLDLIGADRAILLGNHDVARDVIATAAESEGLDSTPIIESDRYCVEVMESYPGFVGNWTGHWPDCLNGPGRAKLADVWQTLMRAETLLKRLEARMMMREREGRMPGGEPMKGRAVHRWPKNTAPALAPVQPSEPAGTRERPVTHKGKSPSPRVSFLNRKGGIDSVASPRDVLKAVRFWRAFPLHWSLKEGKASAGPLVDGILAEHRLLLLEHSFAEDVIVTAAELEGWDSTPIMDSGHNCAEVLVNFPEFLDRIGGKLLAVWPACVNESGRAKLSGCWESIETAETLLRRLEARMKMRASTGQMPGGEPMERRRGSAAALSADDMAILKALSAERATLLLADLAAKLERDVKTVGRRVARLKKAGLVHRPLGPRKGVGITEEGRECLPAKPTL